MAFDFFNSIEADQPSGQIHTELDESGFELPVWTLADAAEQVGVPESALVRLSQYFKIPAQCYENAGWLSFKGELEFTDEELHFFHQVRQLVITGDSLETIREKLLPHGTLLPTPSRFVDVVSAETEHQARELPGNICEQGQESEVTATMGLQVSSEYTNLSKSASVSVPKADFEENGESSTAETVLYVSAARDTDIKEHEGVLRSHAQRRSSPTIARMIQNIQTMDTTTEESIERQPSGGSIAYGESLYEQDYPTSYDMAEVVSRQAPSPQTSFKALAPHTSPKRRRTDFFEKPPHLHGLDDVFPPEAYDNRSPAQQMAEKLRVEIDPTLTGNSSSLKELAEQAFETYRIQQPQEQRKRSPFFQLAQQITPTRPSKAGKKNRLFPWLSPQSRQNQSASHFAIGMDTFGEALGQFIPEWFQIRWGATPPSQSASFYPSSSRVSPSHTRPKRNVAENPFHIPKSWDKPAGLLRNANGHASHSASSVSSVKTPAGTASTSLQPAHPTPLSPAQQQIQQQAAQIKAEAIRRSAERNRHYHHLSGR